MNPKGFDYFRPESLRDALMLLHDESDRKILAGGQSLLALMKLRLAAPSGLIDISSLSALSYIREEKDFLALGALATHDEIEHNMTVRKRFALLYDAANKIGDQQVRNKGTIGGSCCHADPAADIVTVLFALDVVLVANSLDRKREIPVSKFFVDTFTTSLANDEILTEIRVPYLPSGSGSAYVKHSRRANDFAIAGIATVLKFDQSKRCMDARISMGAAASKPVRAKTAEKYLIGKKIDDETSNEAAERAAQEADPIADIHGSKEYRLAMIKVFTRKALKLAQDRVT